MSKKKSVVILCCIFLGYILYKGFLLNGVTTFDSIFTNNEALENVNYVIQIIVGVSVVIGAIIGVWQYVLTARCERAKIKNDRVEKAVQLSEYYKDNILNKVTALRYVFKESGIIDILEKIKPADMVEFDQNELNEKLSKADIQELQKITRSEKVVQAILDADAIYGLDLEISECMKTTETAEGKEKCLINKEKILKQFMSQYVNLLMNNMEYFSMNFTHKVADESVVYQSLHQTYIEVVQILYYNIAKNNKQDGMRYYTNVIDLYKTWYTRYKKKKDKNAKLGRTVMRGTLSEDIDG